VRRLEIFTKIQVNETQRSTLIRRSESMGLSLRIEKSNSQASGHKEKSNQQTRRNVLQENDATEKPSPARNRSSNVYSLVLRISPATRSWWRFFVHRSSARDKGHHRRQTRLVAPDTSISVTKEAPHVPIPPRRKPQLQRPFGGAADSAREVEARGRSFSWGGGAKRARSEASDRRIEKSQFAKRFRPVRTTLTIDSSPSRGHSCQEPDTQRPLVGASDEAKVRTRWKDPFLPRAVRVALWRTEQYRRAIAAPTIPSRCAKPCRPRMNHSNDVRRGDPDRGRWYCCRQEPSLCHRTKEFPRRIKW